MRFVSTTTPPRDQESHVAEPAWSEGFATVIGQHEKEYKKYDLAGIATEDFPMKRLRLFCAAEERFVLGSFEPAYLALSRGGKIAERVQAGLRELEDCCACPRQCHVNRLQDEASICRTGRYARVASAGAHFGEEDCLRGWQGSGTIFFSCCNLRCVFCQNWDISQRAAGAEKTANQIADVMLQLQDAGCHNINFVTPEHVVPQVLEAIADAIPRGLRIPIVYNTSAYDSVDSLRLLDGIVDIYMPDFKFWTRATAKRLAKAPDYPACARRAILEMHRQVGPLNFDPRGLACRGVLVRHLVMPGQQTESASIFRWLAEEVSRDTYLNIMGQYHPAYEVGQLSDGGATRYADVNRPVSREEMAAAYAAARSVGLWRFDERGTGTRLDG